MNIIRLSLSLLPPSNISLRHPRCLTADFQQESFKNFNLLQQETLSNNGQYFTKKNIALEKTFNSHKVFSENRKYRIIGTVEPK